MGKTKIKTIDDSLKEEVKGKKTSRKRVQKDSENSEKPESQNVSEPESQKSDSSETPIPSDTSGTPSPSESSEKNIPKKPQKVGKTKPRSKKYQEVIKDLDRSKTYPIPEAVDIVKKISYAKFNATIEAHINTVQTGIRGLVFLPYASGKKLRILAFGKGAEQSGANIFGDDSTIESISQGKVDFDLLITTPEWMPKLAKIAKVLGPKGLMPNPKNGTITEDLKKAVEGFQAGKTEYEHSSKQVYKTEPKAPVIHLGLGKLDQPTEELSANIKTLLSTLGKSKVKKVSLSPTMGPSVKIDLASI